MKLEELLILKEMPQRTRKELSDVGDEEPMEPFFASNDALKKRGYELVATRGTTEVLITKDRETAIIGNRQKRHDGAEGIMIYGQLLFKTKLKLGADVHDVTENVLQVDVVEITRQAKMEGLGMFLYSSLVQKGFSIITDTLHYEGGYNLWKKIARSHKANEVVYILDHGKVMLDDAGKPIEYDGKNVPEEQIWSDDELKKFVLLIYTKKH